MTFQKQGHGSVLNVFNLIELWCFYFGKKKTTLTSYRHRNYSVIQLLFYQQTMTNHLVALILPSIIPLSVLAPWEGL